MNSEHFESYFQLVILQLKDTKRPTQYDTTVEVQDLKASRAVRKYVFGLDVSELCLPIFNEKAYFSKSA